MAAMTTALTEFADQGNSRNYTYGSHTVGKPSMVLQRRSVPSGNQVVAEDQISVLQGTVDGDGNNLPQRVMMTVTVRRPITGAAADVTTALTTLRDIVAGDEFANTIDSQEWLK